MLRRIGLFVAISTVMFQFSAQDAEAAGAIGKVVAVVGSPSASGPAGSRKLASGVDVFEDDKITVSSGNAQILLNDGTKLVVGPGSTLLLDQFVMRGGSSAEKVSIKALRGTYRFITGRSAKSAYKISTGNATIGIRGTGFDFWYKQKTGVVVLRGSVNLNGFQSGSVRVDSGCEMGEATSRQAENLVGRDKNSAIRENLPFILDQSSLKRQFRLNVRSCTVASLGFGKDEDGSTEIKTREPKAPEPPRRSN